MKTTVTIWLYLSLIAFCFADENKIRLVISKDDNSHVKLRFEPDSWPEGFEGYQIERVELGDDQKTKEKTRVVIAKDIRPNFSDQFLKKNGLTEVLKKKPEFNQEDPTFEEIKAQYREDPSNLEHARILARVDFQWAIAFGMGYIDKNVNKDKSYIYELFLLEHGAKPKKVAAALCTKGESVLGKITITDVKHYWENAVGDRVDSFRLYWKMEKTSFTYADVNDPHQQVFGFVVYLNGKVYTRNGKTRICSIYSSAEDSCIFSMTIPEISRFLDEEKLSIGIAPTDAFRRIGDIAYSVEVERTAPKKKGYIFRLTDVKRSSIFSVQFEALTIDELNYEDIIVYERVGDVDDEFEPIAVQVKKEVRGYSITHVLTEEMREKGAELAYKVRWGEKDDQITEPTATLTILPHKDLVPHIKNITTAGVDSDQTITVEWDPKKLPDNLAGIQISYWNEIGGFYEHLNEYTQNIRTDGNVRTFKARKTVANKQNEVVFRFRYRFSDIGYGPPLVFPTPILIKSKNITHPADFLKTSIGEKDVHIHWHNKRGHAWRDILGFQLMANGKVIYDIEDLPKTKFDIDIPKDRFYGYVQFSIKAVYTFGKSEAVTSEPVLFEGALPEGNKEDLPTVWKVVGDPKSYYVFQVRLDKTTGKEYSAKGWYYEMRDAKPYSIDYFSEPNKLNGASRLIHPEGYLFRTELYVDGEESEYNKLTEEQLALPEFKLHPREREALHKGIKMKDLEEKIMYTDLDFIPYPKDVSIPNFPPRKTKE